MPIDGATVALAAGRGVDADVIAVLVADPPAAVAIGWSFGELWSAERTAFDGEPVALALAELDGEAGDEWLVATLDAVTVLRGGAPFDATATLEIPDVVALTAADLDGDGRLDAVAIALPQSQLPRAVVALGRGDATFEAPIVTESIWLATAEAVVAEDFDDDERTDIGVLTDYWHYVALLSGRGDGTFDGPAELGDRTLEVGSAPSGLAVAYLPGDERPDLASPSAAFDQIWVLEDGHEGLVESARLDVDPEPAGIVAADLDADGHSELIAVSAETGAATIYGYDLGEPLTVPIAGPAIAIAVADVDGSGALDLVALDRGGVAVVRASQ